MGKNDQLTGPGADSILIVVSAALLRAVLSCDPPTPPRRSTLVPRFVPSHPAQTRWDLLPNGLAGL